MDLETRLVNARLQIELQEIDDSIEQKALEEYNTIALLHGNSIEKWLSSLKAKSGDCKCGGGTAILGEMLVHIYKKLEHLESLITDSKTQYLPLLHNIETTQLGHGVILLDSVQLAIEKEYYARLFLPVFPTRCVPLFARAKTNGILEITKIAERDLKDYDSYIVSIEREMLKARKTKNL